MKKNIANLTFCVFALTSKQPMLFFFSITLVFLFNLHHQLHSQRLYFHHQTKTKDTHCCCCCGFVLSTTGRKWNHFGSMWCHKSGFQRLCMRHCACVRRAALIIFQKPNWPVLEQHILLSWWLTENELTKSCWSCEALLMSKVRGKNCWLGTLMENYSCSVWRCEQSLTLHSPSCVLSITSCSTAKILCW